MMNKIKSFLKDDSFQMTIKEDKIYMENYMKIVTLEENIITIQSKEKRMKITGKNLKAKKIVEQQLLITGTVEKIEVTHER